MFWIALAAVVFGMVFTRFGAMSVMVTILSIALKFSLVLLVCVACFLAWHLWKKKERRGILLDKK